MKFPLQIGISEADHELLLSLAHSANRLLKAGAKPGDVVPRVGPADLAEGVIKTWAEDRRRKGGVE